jgi:pyruvate,water dikinase
MTNPEKPVERLIHDLRERAKELNCLYEVQEILSTPKIDMDEVCRRVMKVLPPGWQYPDVCQAEITFEGEVYRTQGFKASAWVQSADIVVQDEVLGSIKVYYTEERPSSDEGPFLKEERKLINTIAEQIGFFFLHQQLSQVFKERLRSDKERLNEWDVILDLLKRTDPELVTRISRKMINYLGWRGIREANQLLEHFGPARESRDQADGNRPYHGQGGGNLVELSDKVFALAGQNLPREVIMDNIQKWIREDRSTFLVDVLVNPASSLADISTALERYHLLPGPRLELTAPRERWFRVSLIRRILNDQPRFINIAQDYIDIDDFSDFMRRVIHPTASHGELGGKSSGLFLAAQILKHEAARGKFEYTVKTPKTWYLTSDSVFHFIGYNNLEDVLEQKYKELPQVRQEYPYILHVFKSSPLPPEIIKGLSLALEDLWDLPLIVRSSSLLEDRMGKAFAGKYKSLFIANKGTKEERLEALMDAIKEVYASLFAPDPIKYRAQHGLLNDHEEMGIMIQQVVGAQAGNFYMPACAGVAFSQNEFHWSSRIRREDGLVRMVIGLGTRAVDRLSDDYPVLVSPGQPGLRVNTTMDELLRYSPRKMDVINLKTHTFETVAIRSLLKECGKEYPLINQLVSVLESDRLRKPDGLKTHFESDSLVVTFDGLITHTPFLKQVQSMLKILQAVLGGPVDIEFAHDGQDFYLLQCRSQSYSEQRMPASIPAEIARESVLFSANRYVTNGSLTDVTHIVYVDPQKYGKLEQYEDLAAIGRVIGRLNQVLPERGFILMGPGRWGSRGDIKLGVNTTYADINNTAMLIEIARKHNGYIPEPSFGTHFFQDLVEASIYYLPLYPDDPKVVFNEQFLTRQKNLLSELVPEFARFSNVIHVVRIPEDKSLQVLMNAERGEAVAFLTD